MYVYIYIYILTDSGIYYELMPHSAYSCCRRVRFIDTSRSGFFPFSVVALFWAVLSTLLYERGNTNTLSGDRILGFALADSATGCAALSAVSYYYWRFFFITLNIVIISRTVKAMTRACWVILATIACKLLYAIMALKWSWGEECISFTLYQLCFGYVFSLLHPCVRIMRASKLHSLIIII